jgi:hypothetical protein
MRYGMQMNRGRAGSSRTVTGLGSVCIGCVGLVAVACGDSFTTAPADGGSAPDAITTSDATGPAADASKDFCASQSATHTFCEDFSDGVPGMFATTVATNGGAIGPDTTDFSFASPSLLATTRSFTGTNATASAVVTNSFANPGSHFSLSLDLKIDGECVPKGDPNPVSILAIEFQEITYNYGIAIQVLPGEIDADEITLVGAAQPQVNKFQTILPTGWQRWTLDINGVGMLGGNGVEKTLNLAVGSTSIFKQNLQKAPAIALQHPTLVVGAVVKNINDPSSPACKVHVDNILFDVRQL